MEIYETIKARSRLQNSSEVPKLRLLTFVYPKTKRALELKKPLVIGRAPGEGQWSIRDNQASRRHLQLRPIGQGCLLEDLESTNGTFLDEYPCRRAVLKDQQLIQAGNHFFVYTEKSIPLDKQIFSRLGYSAPLSQAHHLIDRFATTQHSILIMGPTGAGKESLARHLHQASGRQGAWISANCAVRGGEPLANKLFGQPVGASGVHEGLFIAADKGTLFLDEVSEISLGLQSVLLRALEKRRIRAVGGAQGHRVDVRVIAASQKDLQELQSEGRFLRDLRSRLAQISIDLPGLNERRVDILPLLQKSLSRKMQLSVEAAKALLLYNWPNNLQDIQHLSIQLNNSPWEKTLIDLNDLPCQIRHEIS